MSADELRTAYLAKRLSPVEVAIAHLDRIARRNPELNAYVTVTPEDALRDAREAERVFFHDPDSAQPLTGVPYAMKDLVPTKGIRTTKGSLATVDWVPAADSPLAERLRGSGGTLLGKTTTSALGWKADAGNLVNGPARNPFDPHLTAGGSSGGAAGAVADGLATVAQGGDGAGSVRIPAAFCGVVGIKPGVGVVPYFPPTPLSTIVANGTFGRNVRDAALLLDVMSGADPRDPLSLLRDAGGYRAPREEPAERLRIAYCPSWGGRRAEPEVQGQVDIAVEKLRADGHIVDELETTPADRFDLLHVIWATGFASLIPTPGGDVDPGLIEVIRAATGFSGADLARAHTERQLYKADVSLLFQDYDVLLTPTVSVLPFAAGADSPPEVNGVRANYLDWAWFTYAFNLTEHPAISLPVQRAGDGLPVGIQLVGHHGQERRLIRNAVSVENTLA